MLVRQMYLKSSRVREDKNKNDIRNLFNFVYQLLRFYGHLNLVNSSVLIIIKKGVLYVQEVMTYLIYYFRHTVLPLEKEL